MTDAHYDRISEKHPRTLLAVETTECARHESGYEGRCTQTHDKPLQLLQRRFRRPMRLKNMLWTLVARQVFDLVLWATFVGVIMYTETVDFLNKTEKYSFNAISVGLPLMMGLNYNSSFKSMASMMRWRILASGDFELIETDLILNLDSFLAVTKLGKLWFKKALEWKPGHCPSRGIYVGRSLACFSWILLMLGSQIGIGLLGLTYDFDGKEEILRVNSTVTVSNMSAYAKGTVAGSLLLYEEQYRAHQYGDVADMSIKSVLVNTIPRDDNPHTGSGTIYHMGGTSNWVYRPQDWTPEGSGAQQLLSVPSNRSLTIKTNCTMYHYNDTFDDANGDLAWVRQVDNATLPNDAVTFVNFDFDGQQSDYHCGPRCARIGALSLAQDDATDGVRILNCDVDVSEVQGTQGQNEYQMNDRTALLAGGSIALDGTKRLDSPVAGNITMLSGNLTYQFSRYNNQTYWGAKVTDPGQFAERVGKFAAGSIAMLDYYNLNVSSFQMPGEKVKLGNVGVTLNVKKPELWIVLGILMGFHVLLIPFVLWLGSSVRKLPTAEFSEYLL